MSDLRWTDARRRGLLAFDNVEHGAYEGNCTDAATFSASLVHWRTCRWLREHGWIVRHPDRKIPYYVLTAEGVAELERQRAR